VTIGLLLCALVAVTPVQPGAAEANQQLEQALAHEQAGDNAKAMVALDDLVARMPSWVLPRLEAARLRIKLGRELDVAGLQLETAKALAPENPRAQFLWAMLMEEKGQTDKAIESLEIALLYRPSYNEARFRLASLYFGKENYAKAKEHYQMLARAQPENTSARLQYAASLEKIGQWEEAERELRKLYDENPRSVPVVARLADFYERTGRPKLAEKVRAKKPEPKKKMRPLKPSRR
jgi:tetratricopeptide (TPR) repeat protein